MLSGYTNFDQVGSSDDHHSTFGYVFYLGSSPISWLCKKQHTIMLLSIEVEYQVAIYVS